MKVSDLQSIRIKLASPEEILGWSHGEVLKPETINYRTQRPEKDGLFCEKIFGPSKDYECYCGKYKGVRYKGVICDRCGVEIEKSQLRRERMGHIKLATPCSHIWFLRGVPSRIGMVLDIPCSQIEKVIYFASYIITKVDVEAQRQVLAEIEKEYKAKVKTGRLKKQEIEKLKELRDRAREEVLQIKPLRVLSEPEYRDLSLRYGEIFEAGMGSEILREIFKKIDPKKEIANLTKELAKASGANRKNILRRLRFFQGLVRAKIRPEWMFLTILPVLPPELRPMVQLDGGRFASSDLNDLYRRVINRNNRLKYLLEIAAPEVIVRNEKRMLQEAVDALLDNGMRKGQLTTATTGGKRLLKSLADILEGKQGRFRRNLLGKRVDYSGRSVIAIGPELKLWQCGLPKIMALELFRPFVIKRILDKELAYNIRGAARLVEEGRGEVFAILEEIVKDKLVLLNRAPTLHRLGIQAFQPVLIEGEAIKVHPLVCKAYNADFDGDQMAVYLPLSEEAQQEARDLMFSINNLLKPSTGTPIVAPTQDIILGCYFLTRAASGVRGEGKIFSSFEEVILAKDSGVIDLRAKIKVPLARENKDALSKKDKPPLVETTAGRIIFNQALPEDHPFVNQAIDAKKLSAIITRMVVKKDLKEVGQILDKIKELGFEYSTLSGISWGMDDLIVPEAKKALLERANKEVELVNRQYQKGFLTKEEKASKVTAIWQGIKERVEELVRQTLPKDGTVALIVDSGARGSWAQPVQMAGMKGLVTNPAGRIIEMPVKNSFKEGFDVLEYFISTHGARKGTADTALRTSASGYLTRRLVDVGHEVIVREEDCGDKKGRVVLREDADDLGQDFRFKIIGRVSLEDIARPRTGRRARNSGFIVRKGEIIDWDKAEEIKALAVRQVRVRSPLSCKTLRGVCRKCYGWEMGRGEFCRLGEAVGIIAAQSIGEPGTQLTMRTFHLGGAAGGGDITQGLPRVEEVFELREPKGEAVIAQKAGKVKEVDPEKGILKISSIKGSKREVLEYRISPNIAVFVKKGDIVREGQQLCEGSLNLKKLFKISGIEQTQRYIIKEVQRIYTAEGVDIHDKHIEIIVRQMFSRVRVKEGGDSPWLPGQIVAQAEFQEIREKLKKEGKILPQAVPVLLGISRVALTSESFLSAASFQETSRVLIRASLEGKEDKLRGLKENVIIGRLIPVGTGFKK